MFVSEMPKFTRQIQDTRIFICHICLVKGVNSYEKWGFEVGLVVLMQQTWVLCRDDNKCRSVVRLQQKRHV